MVNLMIHLMMKQAEWSHTWEELVEPPHVIDVGLYIPLRGAKKVLGLFSSGVTGKTVAISSQDKCQVWAPFIASSFKRFSTASSPDVLSANRRHRFCLEKWTVAPQANKANTLQKNKKNKQTKTKTILICIKTLESISQSNRIVW